MECNPDLSDDISSKEVIMGQDDCLFQQNLNENHSIQEKNQVEKRLKIIKINKGIQKRLKEDYKLYVFLKVFISKNNLTNEDIDIKELDLEKNYMGNEGFKFLNSIEFTQLNKLNLYWNYISDLSTLAKGRYKELTELNLSKNGISDISIFEKVNLKELLKLDLSNNEISDIKVLEKVNFINLKELNLEYNKISDLSIFEKVNFKELNKLNLNNNRIYDINALEKANFKKLKELNLKTKNAL